MKRKILWFIVTILIIIGGMVLFFRLTNDNIPTEREKRLDMVNEATITNVPGQGYVDVLSPIYWKNRKYGFFQDYSGICYIIKRTNVKEHKFADEWMNWTEETFIPLFSLYQSNTKKIKFVMEYQDSFYTFKDNLITRYDLKNEKIKKKRIKVNKVLGIHDNVIYLKNNDGYIRVSVDLKVFSKKVNKNELPKRFSVKPVKYKFKID